ncbi:MAG: RDD family protein [Gammaproteobacteria bacterium]|nr:RDD family protein [Gammaproteobacteria bacterium]MBU2056278.1 RDD family protein [Gammaproteobacteria bacterium]MBU2174693.1 RDD family protein [Gammaproteobacteria bacterium]MBU2248854.1 RDD family protein [Gammaproteobacteria bacterium]MBU2344561.1 RDD family protein [Gammaproteobacteria bacterium]
MYHGSPKAGLFRRLAAILYDVLILAALWMLAVGLALVLVTILDNVGLVSLAAYQDQADFLQKHSIWVQLYLLLVSAWFYLYFWMKAGQTLGMRAWRILLIQADGSPVTLKQALLRLGLSLLGVGNFWLWIRWGKGLALQDQMTNTIVVKLTKDESKELNLHRKAG